MTFTGTRQLILESLHETKLITDVQRDQLAGDETGDVDLASLPIDSLKIVDWCTALEAKFNREVEVDELIENDSLNRLARYLSRAG